MNFLISFKQIKNNTFKKENIFFILIILITFFLDRLTKSKIISSFSESTYYLNDYINLDLIWNIGIGFGLLSSDSSFVYNTVTLIIFSVLLILLYFLIISETVDKFIYSIILGGALGNFYDRLIFKAVPDFIDLHFNNLHWFTFNVADIFITIGILAFIIKSFFANN